MSTPKRSKTASADKLPERPNQKAALSKPEGQESAATSKTYAQILDAEFDQILLEGVVERIEGTVAAALDSRKEMLASALLERLGRIKIQAPHEQSDSEGTWRQIESLSALRALVGGRFQNLKDKWVQAGFPLREHRGDKVGEFEINSAGWIDLSSWILKQGFETRLVPDIPNCLFEIRKR